MNREAHGAHHLHQHLPAEASVAAILAIAAVLTSWSSYQGTLWHSLEAVHFGQAAIQRVKATQAGLDASLTRAVEVDLFQAWIEAKSRGDEKLAGFYVERFPADLRGAFAEWQAKRPLETPGAEPTPFALASYRPRRSVEAAALEVQANDEFQAAIKAQHTADAFARASVVLASAMFFAGIGQTFKLPAVKLGVTLIALLSLVLGAAQIVLLPMRALGWH